ncbi:MULTISPECIES: transcriptional regulator [unclassified Archaeoglobus]|jgi:putative transcriptional regulator|uniref:transcriptional regulator n=1 Tax=unclassified Archaeoglobus TaxID=2643606 RepID=UPI0025C584C4|nr:MULTISPECIES: transcriptional regulator [unclassified Archaeoglobus]
MHAALLESVVKILLKADFNVADLAETKPRCFDIVARKDDLILILKVLYNVDSMKSEAAEEMKKLTKILDASPMVIGERFKFDFLERGVVYTRYGLPVINLATFYDFIIEGIPPYVYSAPGGYYVKLDSEKIREVREKLGISIGEMAKLLGVSRRTIKKYEEGTDTSLPIAAKIEEILGTFAIKQIDLLNFVDHEIEEEDISFEGKEGEILDQLRLIGLSVYPVKQAPFDAVSRVEERQILTGIKQVREIEKRARLLGKISEALETKAAYITDRDCKRRVDSVIFVLREELYSVSSPKDFISLLREKSSEN